jgi:hypothetical protein
LERCSVAAILQFLKCGSAVFEEPLSQGIEIPIKMNTFGLLQFEPSETVLELLAI